VSLVIEEFGPALPLRGVVDRAADFHERGVPQRRLETPLVGVVLIVSLGPEMEIDGRRTGSFVAGLWDRPTVTGHCGKQAGYQLYLDLLGARRLLGIPVGELGNRLVALEDIFGAFAAELTERLADACDAQARHAVAQRLLAGRLCEHHGAAPELEYALGRLRATRGAARVEALAAEVAGAVGISRPASREAFGLPPKPLGRLIRVEHAAQRLRAGDPLGEIAYTAGYADQPHFNRDFRELVGCTPAEFPFVQDMLAAV
jgi:AraC-like DNA-binding protein